MKQPTEELEIMPPDRAPAKLPTLGNFPHVGNLSEAEMAAQLKAKLAQLDQHEAAYRFGAMQVGIAVVVWRESLPHGRFLAFLRDHFPKDSKSKLYRYIAGAEMVLKKCGFATAKELAPADKVTPVLSTQLELFTGNGEGLSKEALKFFKFVRGKSLGELCGTSSPAKRGGKTYDRKDADGNLIAGKGAKTLTEAEKVKQATEEISEIMDALNAWFKARHHCRITKDLRAQVDAELAGARERIAKVGE